MSKTEKHTTFYITRHGETDWNVKGIVQGSTDIALNDTGISQAQALRDKLGNMHFHQIFSSDLSRAKQTAEIIAEGRTLTVEATKALREGSMGSFEGKGSDETFALLGNWRSMTEEDKLKHEKAEALREVEPADSMVDRFTTFLKDAASKYKDKDILVVTHGGMIGHLLSHLGYGPLGRVIVGNGALIKIEGNGEELIIKEVEGVKVI